MGSCLPFDQDRLGGILGLRDRIGDHEGDRVADVPDFVAREDRVGRRIHRHAFRNGDAGQAAEIGDIRPGEDKMHARHAARGRGADDAKPRMRMG